MKTGIVTVSPKFQVVIPAEIRKELKLKPKDRIFIVERDGVIRMYRLGNIKEAMGIAKGVTTEGLRDESDRFD